MTKYYYFPETGRIAVINEPTGAYSTQMMKGTGETIQCGFDKAIAANLSNTGTEIAKAEFIAMALRFKPFTDKVRKAIDK
jgi:glutaredoxin-related protein